MTAITMNDALERAGAGAYQRRLMGIFGLVWAADAMQVLAVGFTAASIAASLIWLLENLLSLIHLDRLKSPGLLHI